MEGYIKGIGGVDMFFFFFVLGESEWVYMKLGTLVLLGFGYLKWVLDLRLGFFIWYLFV